MVVSNPKTIDLSDVQGMITRGYGKLFQTAYFLLNVTDAAKAKAWIGEIIPNIDSAEIETSSSKTLHLAFTYSGLKALGLNKDNLQTFPVPFREGMVTDNRSRLLGDYGESDPKHWRWGKAAETADGIHVLLILHAKDEDSMNAFFSKEQERINKSGGFKLIKAMRGYNKEDQKEPFGFHDGISQPIIKGSGRPGPEKDIVATGEFLLGHKNEHNQYPSSPMIVSRQGEVGILADVPNTGKDTPTLFSASSTVAKTPAKDLGRNGTFMVFRQIEQHVDTFWEYMRAKTKNADGTVNEKEAIKLASKCIGRWPSGAALVNFPDEDPGGSPTNDDFGYAEVDPDGLRCPFGSHLRRNNPRDAFRWYKPKQSYKVTNRHRIIRRGRIYTEEKTKQENEIGLHFICFNANIELQFEFIQHAWANNSQPRHLKNDVDVIIGAPLEGDPNNAKWSFTVQEEPVNKFYEGWERFITIRGGQYFFMPSISVLNFIKTI